MSMAEIGPGVAGGSCRLALTDVDREGRDLFVKWCTDAGCTITLDDMGNIFARRAGLNNKLAPIVAGSHLDTQPHGGKFDGIYAVSEAVSGLGYTNQQIISGAGHDACQVCQVCQVVPTAMIFVPCAGGLSHNEQESAEPDDLEAGCNVLLQAMLKLAN